MKLTPRELMGILNLREWAALCSMVDEFGPAQMIAFKHGDGSEVQPVKGQLILKRFDVVKVRRENEKIFCWLDFGKGVMQWYEIKERSVQVSKNPDVQVAA